MNTLENYIAEYLEYCKYRKHLDVHFQEAKLLSKTIPFHSIQKFLSVLYSLMYFLYYLLTGASIHATSLVPSLLKLANQAHNCQLV